MTGAISRTLVSDVAAARRKLQAQPAGAKHFPLGGMSIDFEPME